VNIYDGVYQIHMSTNHFGYVLNREGYDLIMMFGIGMFFRVNAYLNLILMNREKQGSKPLLGIKALGI
jgi:hypothetical protein